jgi:hypothetical protein
MEKQQIIMELEFSEYEALRQEIIANAAIIADVFTISITAAVVILGYGIQREQETEEVTGSWLLFLCPLGILAPSLWFISSQLESTVQIATYIQTFIETGQDVLNWETRLSLLRQVGTSPGTLYTFSISTVYIGLGLVSFVLSIYYVFKNQKETRARILRIAFCVALFIPMGIACQQFNMRLTPQFTQEYKEKWEAVGRLEKESNAKSQPTLK